MRIFAFADEASPLLVGQIDAMKRNRLSGLEIRNVDGQNVSALSLDKACDVQKRLKDEGLIVWSVGSPIGKIDIEKDDFIKHLDVFRHTLDVARALQAENIRLFSFYIPQDKQPSDYRQCVIDRMSQFAEIAEGSGVTLCHENEKGIYGDIAPRCLEIHEAIPAIKAVFDPANYIQSGQETLSAWALLHPHVKYLHIKDALESGVVVPAGRGAGHLPEILAAFSDQGGNHVTIEPHLRVFDGLKALEHGERPKIGEDTYESGDAAFDAACNALKALL